jgi:AcrR family transcriptional regulator
LTTRQTKDNPKRKPKVRSKVLPPAEEDGTRERLKSAAMRLFSIHGIDGVTVRDIVSQAGARNGASLHYYFRTKDDLVRELVVDAAKRSDRARNMRLDRLEPEGGPKSVKDILRLIVEVETIDKSDPDQVGALPIGFGHMRFVVAMQFNHRKMFLDAIGDRWNKSYLRCIAHLRRLLSRIPPAILSQRLVFMFLFTNAALAAREAAFEGDPTGGRLWGRTDALENLIDTIACGLKAGWPDASPRETADVRPFQRSYDE